MVARTRWGAICVTGALSFFCAVGPARGTPIVFSGSQGNLSALAAFRTSGNNLIITLTNNSPADVVNPAGVLTCLFFDISGATLSLTPASAVIGPTSVVLFGTTDPGGVVGGEWAYDSNLSGAPGGGRYGVGSSGLGLFGSNSPYFPGNNLQGPVNVNGLQYGITSAGDNPAVGNSPVTGDNALIKDEVVFTLSGLPANFDPATLIGSVVFQYGTATSEPSFPGNPVPEPSTLVLLALGAAIGLRRVRA